MYTNHITGFLKLRRSQAAHPNRTDKPNLIAEALNFRNCIDLKFNTFSISQKSPHHPTPHKLSCTKEHFSVAHCQGPAAALGGRVITNADEEPLPAWDVKIIYLLFCHQLHTFVGADILDFSKCA